MAPPKTQSASGGFAVPGARASIAPSNASRPTASPSPSLRMPQNTTINTPRWWSVKNPDLLSASERVVHNNLAVIATTLDTHSQILTVLAGKRGGSTAKETTVDPAIEASDNRILDQLDDNDLVNIIRDQFLQFAGLRKGQNKTLTSKMTKQAESQATEFVKHVAEAAAQEAHEAEEAEPSTEGGQTSPMAHLHSLLEGLSDKPRKQWVLSKVNDFKLGGFTAAATKGGKSRAGGKRGRDEEEEEDDDDEGAQASKRPKATPRGRGRGRGPRGGSRGAANSMRTRSQDQSSQAGGNGEDDMEVVED